MFLSQKFMKRDLASLVDLVVATPGTLLQFRQKGTYLIGTDLTSAYRR